ncbi:MAG: fatty acid desaturase family protein [Planctomycetota bacterium]
MRAEDGRQQDATDRRGKGGILRLDFAPDVKFREELHRRVDELFETTGRPKRGPWQMYLKSAIILAIFGVTWWLLVFVAETLVQGLVLAGLLGLWTALIGFNIQHDGGHRAYSRHHWVNRIAAGMLGLIGGSSYTWRWKHSVIHHRYTNVAGYDHDIDIGLLGRFSPHQKRMWYHRWQHLYLWLFYGLEAVKLQLVDDFRYLITGRIGPHRIGRPMRWELVNFVLGKAAFLSLAFVVPMLLHPVWVVLFYYAVAAWVLGMVMVLIFVTPHLVAEAEFPAPPDGEGIDRPWAEHQALVTVNFGCSNRVLTWLLGGLNFHKEHHLFPVICHVNYPDIAPVVEETCREFGVPYKAHRSLASGIAAHYRWLRRMGMRA